MLHQASVELDFTYGVNMNNKQTRRMWTQVAERSECMVRTLRCYG